MKPPGGVGPNHPHGPYVLAGIGGEHRVWRDPYFYQLALEGDPAAALVYKLHIPSLWLCNAESVEESYTKASDMAASLNERFNAFKQNFDDMALWQESAVHRVHLTPDQVESLWKDHKPPLGRDPNGALTTYAVVTRQDYVWEFENLASYVSLTVPYVEWAHERGKATPSPELATRVNHRWLTQANNMAAPTPVETADFLTYQDLPWLEILLAQDNEVALAGLGRFVKAAITDANQRRQTPDMSENNVLLTQEGAIKLIDALYPTADRLIDSVPAVMQKIQADQAITFRDNRDLLNGARVMRTLNFLAGLLKLSERITSVCDAGIEFKTWAKAHIILASATRFPRSQHTEGYLSVS